METGVYMAGLLAGFAIAFIGAFVFAVPAAVIAVFRRLTDA